MELGLEVAPAPRPARGLAATTTVEQVAEDVADITDPEAAALAATSEAHTGAEQGTGLVVLLAPVGIAHHVVGRRDLLELLLGVPVARIGIGVPLLGELAVGLADLLVVGVFRDTQLGV